ncbi:aminoacyl-tRNA hydrolase, partial [Clostridium perfringens]|nr:aminoacyl-tRNA hydrolase [Clostridium perfringens]
VGQPNGDLVSHVLGRFSKEESEVLMEVIEASLIGVEGIIKDGTKEAMNKLNGFKASKKQ